MEKDSGLKPHQPLPEELLEARLLKAPGLLHRLSLSCFLCPQTSSRAGLETGSFLWTCPIPRTSFPGLVVLVACVAEKDRHVRLLRQK